MNTKKTPAVTIHTQKQLLLKIWWHCMLVMKQESLDNSVPACGHCDVIYLISSKI